MSLIDFDLSADAANFIGGIESALDTLERFEDAATRTQRVVNRMEFKAPKASSEPASAADSVDTGASKVSDQMSQVQGSFASALRPLSQFAAQIASQFDKVGGTIVTLARRIDSAMKMQSMDAMLTKIQGLEERFSHATRAAAGLARVGLQIRSTWSSIGDVAGKSLSSLMGLNLSRPIGQAVRLKLSFQSISTTVNRLKLSVISLGVEIAAAFGAFMLVFKGVQFIKGATKEASNLNETINKTGLVFDRSAGMVTKAADEMAARYGTLKTSFLDVADQYGQLLQGMGRQTKAAAASTSVELTKLTADASSLFNEGFEEASRRISSALRGQSEPISAWGIDVTEAAVKQEAWRMGLAKLGQELDTAQKVAARTSLVMRGLAVAQGDLARTGDQPANAARRFAGSMQNAGAALMANFLPAIQKGLALLNEFAAYLNAVISQNQEGIAAFATRVGSALEAAAKYLRNLPLVWEIVVLKFQEGIANIIAVFKSIPENLAIIGDWLAEAWPSLVMKGIGLALKGFGLLLQGLLWVQGKIIDALPAIGMALGKILATAIYKGFKGGITALFTAGEGLDLPKLVAPQFKDMGKEIEERFKAIHLSGAEKAAAAPGAAVGGGAARIAPPPIDNAAVESMKKLEDKAKTIFDETRTPMEKFRSRMAEIGTMLKAGLINQETYNRAKKAADEEFRSKAKSVFDETRTPLEKFQTKLTEIKGYLDQGLIDQDTFDRAKKMATEDLKGGEPKFAGALEFGSSEARSAILKHQQGGRDTGIGEVAKNTKQQVDLQQKTVDILDRFLGKAVEKGLELFAI